MRMHFSPHILALVTLCVAISLVAVGLPVSAQNARPRTNVPQADLRIRVIVVPAVALHRHHKDKDKDKDRDEAAVTYDLHPKHEEFSITEEMRPMLVDSGTNAARHEQVRIITVVPK